MCFFNTLQWVFHPGKRLPQIFLPGEKSRNNPTLSPVMAAVHPITTKRTTKLQTRRHHGRLFNSFFNRRTTTLQTFIQWHQDSALLFFSRLWIEYKSYQTRFVPGLSLGPALPKKITTSACMLHSTVFLRQ